MSILTRPREIARQTPDDRLRSIDMVRSVSMLVVVFGHWLMALVWINTLGEAQFGDALTESRVLQYVTWILQVMPLFFLAGGFSNGRSIVAARNAGTPRREWLASRAQRLITPTLPVIAVWSLGVFALGRFIDPGLLRVGTIAATIPMWFLAVYLMAVVAAPFTYAAWERWGFASVAFGAGMAILIDVLRVGFDVQYVGYLNFLVVWLTIHQLGHGWDRRPKPRTGWLLAGLGLLLLVGLTQFGPYSVAMVGVDGAREMSNNSPPTVALLALALFQAGWLAGMTPTLEKWLKRETPWSVVILSSGFTMSVYLWHMTAMVLLVLVSLSFAQGLLQAVPLSADWWVTRPIWIAILIIITLPLVLIFQRFEHRSARRVTRHPVALGFGVAIFAMALAATVTLGLSNAEGETRLWIPLSAFVGATLAGVLEIKPKSNAGT
ncbi:MAG: acyltransferase [Acidimicrobiia bacterium]|nr:acyltransferase [Acidimicrobiia bacterium]